MDVNSLYNNIPHADGAAACRTFLNKLQYVPKRLKKLEAIAHDKKCAPEKRHIFSFLETINENAVFDVVIFVELMTLAFELCSRGKEDFSSYISGNRVWICFLMGCSRSVLKSGESVDSEISFARLIVFLQGILGGECLRKVQHDEGNLYVACGLGALVAVGQRKHTKGVISELSKRAVRNIISVIREMSYFFT